MRAIVLISVLCAGLAVAFPQQAIDPAYLRQYYQQIAQQAGAQSGSAQARADATPIYEQGAQEQQHVPQYAHQQQQQQGQQIQRQYQQPQQYQPQYQPQQVQYVQEQQYNQPKQLKVSKPRPAQQYQKHVDEEEADFDHNPNYQFGFDVKDDEFTNYQNRKEQREGNVIKGSYSVVDSDGFIRTVTYTADPKEGFKAEVSRQPTDIVVKTPKPYVEPQSHHQQQHQQQQQQQQQQHRIQQQPQKARPDYTQYQ